MASYPDNLLYYLKSMQGYSRNNVKILPLTQTAGVRQGDTMQFRLPTNSLIDLSTWTLHGHRKLTYPLGASGHKAMFGKDTASMIRGLQIQIGGQTIQNLDAYNVVWQALKDQTMSPAAEKCLGYLEGAYVNLKGGAGGNITVQNATDELMAPFIVRNWLGFFQASPSILDTALTGEIVVTLTFDPDRRNWAAGTAGANQCGFELEQLYSTVDLISIQDGVYEMVARQALESGMMLEIPVPSYYKFESNNASQSYTTRFTIGCQSLDAAMVLQRLTDRKFEDPLLHHNASTGDLSVAVNAGTPSAVAIDESKIVNVTATLTPTQAAAATAGGSAAPQQLTVNFASGAFPSDSVNVTQPTFSGSGSLGIRHKMIQSGLQFNGTAATDAIGNGWYFEVNGAHVPSHRVRRSDTLHYNKIAFGVHGTDHGNLMALALQNRLDEGGTKNKAHVGPDLDEVFSTQYIPVMRFNHASSDKRLLSGIDCRSNPVQLSYTAVGAGTGGTSTDAFKDDKPRVKKDGAYGSEAGSAIDTMVVALCTSTLMLGAGQQLSFSA